MLAVAIVIIVLLIVIAFIISKNHITGGKYKLAKSTHYKFDRLPSVSQVVLYNEINSPDQ